MHLSPVEARVLGCLIEKEINTPEYYPLTLNATVNACNQKSSREPVMELTESDVRTALFDLEGLGLVKTRPDSRATKYEHRVRDVLNLRRDETALLCLLLLRGPQTSAELRTRAERMFTFDDNAAATATLERLAQRQSPLDPLTFLMQRQPGAREARWMHLLSGASTEAPLERNVISTEAHNYKAVISPEAHNYKAVISTGAQRSGETPVFRVAYADPAAHPADPTDLEARIRALEARVAALEAFPHNTPD
jgi:uncharacterized protein YceH (UPF0502 family)